jgi:hypothetical protein
MGTTLAHVLPALASVTRRDLLARAAIGAAAVVVVSATGVTWRMAQQNVLSPGSGDAYAAWTARLVGDGPLSLVRAAVLASNAHDTQPWIFRIGDGLIDLFADRVRNIGTLDPLRREMEVSLGCALENLVLAAGANELTAHVTLLPSSDSDHIARVTLETATTDTSLLFDAIPVRHTNRAAYQTLPVGREALDAIAGLAADPQARVTWLDADPARARFGELTVQATAAIIGDPEQANDDYGWYRQDWDEIQVKRDGITLDAAGLSEPLRIAARPLPPIDRTSLQSGWLDATRTRHVATAAAYGLVLVKDRADTRARIAAGRLFQRAHLWTTGHGLAVQPLNQIIERADRERSLSLAPVFGPELEQLTPPGWQAVMAFRIGHPTSAPRRAPRHLAEEVIRGI